MPIKLPEDAPAAALEQVLANVHRIDTPANATDAANALEVAVAADAPPKSGRARVYRRPYPVYSASLESVIDGDPLKNVQLAALQYVVLGDDDSVQGLAEVVPSKQQEPSFSWNATYSPESALNFFAAVDEAEKDSRVRKGTYELRVLRVPDAHLQALWLHGAREDLMLPIRPAPSLLQKTGLLSPQQICELVRPLAILRRDTDDTEPLIDVAGDSLATLPPAPLQS